MAKLRYLSATALCALLISACGGGDSSSAGAGTDYVSKYVGTWKTACWVTSIYQDTANANASSYLTRTQVITKSSNAKVLISITDTVYASTDTTCSGAVAATVIRTGQNTGTYNASNPTSTITSSLGENSLTYAGGASIAGATTADNVDAVQAALHSIAGTNITIGTVALNSNNFTAASGKGAVYLNGTTLTYGQGGGATYPTALQVHASGIYTKQP